MTCPPFVLSVPSEVSGRNFFERLSEVLGAERFFPPAEPINPEAWHWYNENVGKKECAIVDTWWQTETGSIMITPLPGATKVKPGSATFPFWGVEPVLLDPNSGKVLEGNGVEGVLAIKQPWPAMARTIFNDHSVSSNRL
jgi:acyl-coenzyme A synthetase/AMP-(fatty) acid ligase